MTYDFRQQSVRPVLERKLLGCDEVGNRPCDNGAVCDRCMTDEACNMWDEYEKTHKANA